MPQSLAIAPAPGYNPLQVFTYAQVAELLQVSEKTVQRLVDNKKLRTVHGQRRGSVRISAGELYRYIYEGGEDQ